MNQNKHCKPGDLLRARSRFETGYTFLLEPESKNFCFDFSIAAETKCNKGDFLIWLQEDHLMSNYCFCLHQPTGRVLCVPTYHLEIVYLEAEEGNEPE